MDNTQNIRWKQLFQNFEKAVFALKRNCRIERWLSDFERISPKYVFKDAYKSKYIDDIDVWIEMTNNRTLMSHTYDSLKLSEILKNIKEAFYSEMLKMYNYFKTEI